MAQMSLRFYKGQDRYTDGNVENDMLKYAKEYADLDQIALSDGRWPVFYHFSKLRENILNWYDFKEDCSILEVGAGCGALTGLLCKKAKKVCANEMSKQRADILYNRYRSVDNLDIIVGSVMEIELEQKFDYVILMGVLEYAGIFCEGYTPYNDLVNRVRGFLKPQGRLLIGIENRFGIKYFSGAPEDHTGGFFDGINRYRNEKVKTFNKTEIIEILQKSGFINYKFYYPYPDYKFTKEVFTEQTLHLFTNELDGIALPDSERFMLFNDNLVLKDLAAGGLGGYFCNSFLIETSIDAIKSENCIDYARINADRKSQFSISTIIKSNDINTKKVYKFPLTEEAEGHIENIIKSSIELNNDSFNYIPCVLSKNTLEMDFVNFSSMDTELHSLFKNMDVDKIWHMFDILWNELKKNSFWCDNIYMDDFRKVFGNEEFKRKSYFCLNPANIDLTFSNMFLKEKRIYVIDAEWVFKFPIPIDFIFWRAVTNFYLIIEDQENLIISIDNILNRYSINVDDIQAFKNWNIFFYKHYVEQGGKIERFQKPTYNLSFKDIIKQMSEESRFNSNVNTYLYLDMGQGYSEETKLTSKVKYDFNIMHITFDIPNGTKSIRWDPIENEWCVCKIMKIYTDISELSAVPYNAIRTEEGDVFLSLDPVYNIRGTIMNATRLTIDVMITIGDKSRLGEILYEHIKFKEILFNKEKNELDDLLTQKDKFIENLSEKEIKNKLLMNDLLDQKDLEINELNLEISRMQKTMGWKVYILLKKIKAKVMNLFKRNPKAM